MRPLPASSEHAFARRSQDWLRPFETSSLCEGRGTEWQCSTNLRYTNLIARARVQDAGLATCRNSSRAIPQEPARHLFLYQSHLILEWQQSHKRATISVSMLVGPKVIFARQITPQSPSLMTRVPLINYTPPYTALWASTATLVICVVNEWLSISGMPFLGCSWHQNKCDKWLQIDKRCCAFEVQ